MYIIHKRQLHVSWISR